MKRQSLSLMRWSERLLRAAAMGLPDAPEPRVYLAQLLEARGDRVGAEVERAEAARLRRPGVEIAALAPDAFWVDPVHGGVRLRGD